MRHLPQQFTASLERARPGRSRFRWLEVLVISVAAPLLGAHLTPHDPYLLHATFPWLVLAPLLVALQHGLWAGGASAALLCAGAYAQTQGLGTLSPMFLGWSLGLFMIAILAGQLRDALHARSLKWQARTCELQARVERSERGRHVLQLSHAKLSERLAATRSSLAGAVDSAQRRMAGANSLAELGQVLLDTLASQGQLHAASLYLAGREPSVLVEQPVASFGAAGVSSARHTLVRRAFASGKLAAIVDAGESDELSDDSVLAAVPLLTAERKVVGVVAVHQLPFIAFQADQLHQLFLLAGHLTDLAFDRWNDVHTALGEQAAAPVTAKSTLILPPAPEPGDDDLPELSVAIEAQRASQPEAALLGQLQPTSALLPNAFRVSEPALPAVAYLSGPQLIAACALPSAPAPAGFSSLPPVATGPARASGCVPRSITTTQELPITPAAGVAVAPVRNRRRRSVAQSKSAG